MASLVTKKRKVLVADDDSSILRVVGIILGNKGIKVITAEDGEEAYRKAVAEEPDAILLDITMPKMDGFEVLAKLKETPSTAGIPVAFFTAHKDFSEVRKAQEMGSLVYISKPFKPNVLVESVNLLLGSRKDEDE